MSFPLAKEAVADMRTVKTWKLAIVGFGLVGKAFVKLLQTKEDELERRYGFKAKVCLVVSRSHGTALNPDGLEFDAIMKSAGGRIGPEPVGSFEELLRASGADVMIEVTPTTRDGEAGLRHIRAALAQGIHVITANKGPIALAYEELVALAAQKGVSLRFEATVQSGTPLFAMIREGLTGCSFTGAQGILNASTNMILTAMESGKNYDEACSEAYEVGLIEKDPIMDVEGWDAALKVTILGKVLFGSQMTLQAVKRVGIDQVTPAMIEDARRRGARIKLLAELRQDGEKIHASVRPTELPLSNPFAQLDGADNMVALDTDNLGIVSIRGSGGGGLQTSQGLLSDLLSITRLVR
jgi:homoserine dehydrogenase